MYIQYPDNTDPFSINDGAKQAEWFAERFRLCGDSTEQCLVLSDANGNIRGEQNCDKFGEMINISRSTYLYETMLTIGDRLHEWEPKELDWHWCLILFALVDDPETESIVEVKEKLNAGAIEAALLLLSEMRQKRFVPARHGVSARSNE